jgi:hypothetical protein
MLSRLVRHSALCILGSVLAGSVAAAKSSTKPDSSTPALNQFGGIRFGATVPYDQRDLLAGDLEYLYTNPNPIADADFIHIAKLSSVQGDHLHNWILNRLRLVVGETFDLEKAIVGTRAFQYPNASTLDTLNLESAFGVRAKAKLITIMRNVGASYYYVGKTRLITESFGVDPGTKDVIYVESPRAGLVQIGEGLFAQGFHVRPTIANHPANSVKRMGVFFHEARHSDGSGSRVIFPHEECPLGHDYAGLIACDRVGNGSYMIGALAIRQLAKNCKSCNGSDQLSLDLTISDSFNRVIPTGKSSQEQSLRESIEGTKALIESLKILIEGTRGPKRAEYVERLHAYERKLADLQFQLQQIRLVTNTAAPIVNDAPEGSFRNISLSESRALMNESLERP